MKIVNMVCPNCGASLQVDADKKNLTCNYCGNNLFIDDEVHHVRYDNAEEAGYQFEKGRQRAQAESRIPQGNQQVQFNPNQPPKKKRTWLWVLGWICIFPVPLTILLLRNKTLDKKIKYGIIGGAWILYFIIALTGKGTNNNNSTSEKHDNNVNSVVQETSVEFPTTVDQEMASTSDTTEIINSSSKTESQQESSNATESSVSDSLTQEGAVDSLVEKFNSTANTELSFSEDFVVSSKDSGHYRTEFRLGAYKDAVGKSYNYNDKSVDIVATKEK